MNTLKESVISSEKLGSKTGVPVIVMHGWGQTRESMRALAELLSQFHAVYILDLPGFGASAAPVEDADTVTYAEMLKEFLECHQIEKAHLIGHSFGGRVSIRFGSRYPQQVSSITLINSGGLKRKLEGKRKWRSYQIKLLSNACKLLDKVLKTSLYRSWFTPKFGSRDYLNASGVMRKVLVRAVNEDVTEDAEKITTPTFLLWGEKDEETPLEMGERFSRLIPNAKLTVLPGKDHFPFLGDGAHICAHHILGFLKSTSNTNGG